MATYAACMRSSYFRVKNNKEFTDWFESLDLYGVHLSWKAASDMHRRLPTDGDDYDVVTVLGSDCGIPTDVYVEGSDEEIDFLAKLQEHLHPDWAAIFQETGYEKLSYLVGTAVIVEPDDIKSHCISNWAVENVSEGKQFTAPEY